MYAGHFPRLGHESALRPPPVSFRDAAGRELSLRAYDGSGEDYEALVELYRSFDPEHRSLGIPPRSEPEIREWLDVVLEGHCVVAWHGERAVGQAVLVEDAPGTFELAIFVHQDYHGAGVGTRLLEATLSLGRARGVEHVWLFVERANRPAVNLYRDVGFAVVEELGFDVRMALTL